MHIVKSSTEIIYFFVNINYILNSDEIGEKRDATKSYFICYVKYFMRK